MKDIEIETIRAELIRTYRGCRVIVSEDMQEIVAEIKPGRAVAVIERSQPHFHLKTRETYRILRGTLHLAVGGQGHVLHEDGIIIIEPGHIHFARAASQPVWIEVESVPPWTPNDHFIL